MQSLSSIVLLVEDLKVELVGKVLGSSTFAGRGKRTVATTSKVKA